MTKKIFIDRKNTFNLLSIQILEEYKKRSRHRMIHLRQKYVTKHTLQKDNIVEMEKSILQI